MDYMPQPIDVSDIELPEDLEELRELLAKNAHEIWAAERFNDGWKYGPERNDKLKTNPNLIPYEELTEIEKKFDRIMAMDTIRLIIKMGYGIRKD